jgi:hypothetical protein
VCSLVTIVLLTLLVFANILVSSTEPAPSLRQAFHRRVPTSNLYHSCLQRRLKALGLLLGATHNLHTTTIASLPEYRPRYLCGLRRLEVFHINKLMTALSLVAVAVLFSRQYVPTWIGARACGYSHPHAAGEGHGKQACAFPSPGTP